MKQVKTLALLITMVLSSVVLNAQALTQTYDRAGVSCKYPSGYLSWGDSIAEGIAAHVFADDAENPKNAMALVNIQQDVLRELLQKEGVTYEQLLGICVGALVSVQGTNWLEELQKELGFDLKLEEWNVEKWQLDRLNLKGINVFDTSLEEFLWAVLNKVFDWGVNAIYDVTFDLAYQAIKLGIIDELSTEEDVNIKVKSFTNNFIEILLWEEEEYINIKLHKIDNRSVTLILSGVIDGTYGEGSVVLYKANENTLAISVKASADDLNLKASAKLSMIDKHTLAITLNGQGLSEIIGEDLNGIQFGKALISLRNNNIIIAGWAAESVEMMSVFDAMYRTVQFKSYSPIY